MTAWDGHYVDFMAFENLKSRISCGKQEGGRSDAQVYDGERIPKSSIINEFLDDRFPEPVLKPADALERARMRYWVKVEEDELFTAIRPASLNLMMKRYLPDIHRRISIDLLATHPRQLSRCHL